jgi:hypothetical protein
MEKIIDDIKWLTVPEYSKKYNLERRNVIKLIEKGIIPGHKSDDKANYAIPPEVHMDVRIFALEEKLDLILSKLEKIENSKIMNL